MTSKRWYHRRIVQTFNDQRYERRLYNTRNERKIIPRCSRIMFVDIRVGSSRRERFDGCERDDEGESGPCGSQCRENVEGIGGRMRLVRDATNTRARWFHPPGRWTFYTPAAWTRSGPVGACTSAHGVFLGTGRVPCAADGPNTDTRSPGIYDQWPMRRAGPRHRGGTTDRVTSAF